MTSLNFLDDGQSIASAVSQLHSYFKNAYTQCKLDRASLISRLDSASEDEEQEILYELQRIDDELTFFGALTDSLSTANRLLHSRVVANTLGIDAEVFEVHLEDELEQSSEREAAQRRAANRSVSPKS
jgi:hypothetical protein